MKSFNIIIRKFKNINTVKIINYCLMAFIAVNILSGCLSGKIGFSGEIITQTDTIRFSDHPRIKVSIK